jgi:hypothetical protein
VSGILNSLVSKGNVRNDSGTYRFLTMGGSRAASPVPARSSSPSSYRPATPVRSSSPAARAPTPVGAGSGAVSSDEETVLKVLQNYSGLTADRLSAMLRASGK